MLIRPGTKEDFQAIANISDEQLGTGYLRPDTLEKIMAHRYSSLRVCEENMVHSFLLTYELPADELQSVLRLPNESKINWPDTGRVGILKTIATRTSAHGRGMASRLITDWMEEYKDSAMFYSLNWNAGHEMPLDRLLENWNFKKEEEWKKYWKKQSILDGSVCPACGPPPCHCSAILYSKTNLS